MPLQNRVTPFGDIIATPERGTMLGNRGVLHNDQKEIVRNYQHQHWICCLLEFRGRHRVVMTPGKWTELFFLDEVTAFAAGHRPCFECRNKAAKDYQKFWAEAHGAKVKANSIDTALEYDRKLPNGNKRTYVADTTSLPNGTFIAQGNEAWLLYDHRKFRWTPGGYVDAQPLSKGESVILTPKATVAVLRAGYQPGIHSTALPFQHSHV